jgi:hypothetical protein
MRSFSFLRRLARFTSWTVVWSVIALIGCSLLALGAYACELAADMFLTGKLLVPMNRALSLFFGITIDLMGMVCVIGFIALGVCCMKKIGDVFTIFFPAPNFLTEFF